MELYFKALLLGVIEGLTEFLPVSSTGHLILFGALLKFDEIPGHVFEIVIQLGAILAICVVYRQRLWRVAAGVWNQKSEQRFVLNILLAFLPAMILGALLHDVIKARLFNPTVVAASLILGGVVMIVVERLALTARYANTEEFPPRAALMIGLCQSLAMVPGVSRSGATIIGARLLGASRQSAAEFSFFLAVPTMLAATAYDLYKNGGALLASGHLDALLLGFAAAFLTALAVVSLAIRFINAYGFAPFGWYRIALGAVVLWLMT